MSIWTYTTIACDYDQYTPCVAEYKTGATEAEAVKRARHDGWTVSRRPGLTPGTTHYEARCPRHAHRRSR